MRFPRARCSDTRDDRGDFTLVERQNLTSMEVTVAVDLGVHQDVREQKHHALLPLFVST